MSEKTARTQKGIAGIVLAAGGATRFGGAKQLAIYQGKPFVVSVVEKALGCGLEPVLVITGAYHAETENLLRDYPIAMHYNADWHSGISTSIRLGLTNLPEEVDGAIILMCDQPRLPAELIHDLMAQFEDGFDFIVPQSNGQLRNPVLIHREAFARVMSLRGDAGARTLFASARVKLVQWDDEHVFDDIDLRADLDELKNLQ
ncbi:MAG: nucleotidyltransferase family protein [Chloroflexi bacterium]|nr:nucleotidyltransferase family protein [Chloroflexota bacterium]